MRKRTLAIALAGVLGAAAVAAAIATRPGGVEAAGPKPASVGALNKAANATIPAAIAAKVSALAGMIKTDPAAAAAGTRLLRTGLGRAHETLYAFPAREGGVCFINTGRGSVCPTSGATADERVTQWLLAGGWTKPDGTVVPDELYGVVGDDVQGVALDLNGAKTSIPVVNNTYFAELPTTTANDEWNAQLVFTYQDGHTRTQRVPNPVTGG